MIKRTHLVIGLAFALLFLPFVNYKLIFFPVVLICSLLPDIDSPNSYFGHHKLFRPLQWVAEHRGFLHSFTVCIVFSVLLGFFIPILALPFFLGYASHLVADSFTKDGITPFWPWKKTSSGIIRTGGHSEYPVFIGFLILDAILFIRLFV